MFAIYVLFLILSGIAMLIMAFVRADYAKRRQVLNFVFGAGFLIYGLYLLLAFHGGSYVIFYYVFVVPIAMIVNFFRARSAAQARKTASRPPAQPAQPAQGGFPQADSPQGTDPGPGTWANASTPGNQAGPSGW